MDYEIIGRQIQELLETEPWYVAACGNISAVLMEQLSDLNWAGFYLLRGDRLTVGPFQGKPACIHIEVGKGVCGTAVKEDRVVNVPDVHRFPGHIACDGASRSELVLPLRADGRPVAVLDLDSPLPARFTEADEQGLRGIAEIIEKGIRWD